MSIVYKPHKKYPDSIFIREFYGKIKLNEILKSWVFLSEKILVDSSVKGLINNLLEAELEVDINDFEFIISQIIKLNFNKKIKIAVITVNPKTIVFPIMAESYNKDLNIKTFSSIEAAENWILNQN